MLRRTLVLATAAACTAALAGAMAAGAVTPDHHGATGRAADSATAGRARTQPVAPHRTPAHRSAASGVQLETWLYPGGAGDSTCTAASEYADGRVANGALKPEYWSVDGSGAVTLETTAGGVCNTYSAAGLADLKAHSAYQYPTVSAMTTADVHALVSSSSKRTAAVTQLTDFTVQHDVDGVDVDMEDYWSWSAADLTNYEKFLKQLATSLHAQGKKLLVDAPAMTEDADFYDYAAVSAQGVDELEIMAYDEEFDTAPGARCLPITPLNWLGDVTRYAQSKVPDHNRLVIALPSYGISAPDPCDLDDVTGNIQYSDMAKSPGFSTDPATVAARRDASSGEIRWVSGGRLYDYVDTTALDRKLAVLTSLGVTRVSVWSLGGGNPWFTR
ncbi:glycosyl hydrolase family 18 protein [Actinacidiphila sp. DG2A-62]|uniref:glycosyl hydrolase family 18 protein n=1 Tax=Actinacidiphila sp. DG2A-62 TaxID=3108821 RepID=UPI002DBDAD5A|nr:glycosyl hydrolase family 18 protein [Actinacidiphila sp. DG2A-62]MEC3994841.1 glycosyl hydrolase family 18 protein [Actinacidiphila sp. DG2A-62]